MQIVKNGGFFQITQKDHIIDAFNRTDVHRTEFGLDRIMNFLNVSKWKWKSNVDRITCSSSSIRTICPAWVAITRAPISTLNSLPVRGSIQTWSPWKRISCGENLATKENLKEIIRDRWHDFHSTMCFARDHRIYDEQANAYRWSVMKNHGSCPLSIHWMRIIQVQLCARYVRVFVYWHSLSRANVHRRDRRREREKGESLSSPLVSAQSSLIIMISMKRWREEKKRLDHIRMSLFFFTRLISTRIQTNPSVTKREASEEKMTRWFFFLTHRQ